MSTVDATRTPASNAPGIDGWHQRLRDRGQLAGLGFGGSAPYAASQLSAVRHLAFLPAEALELDLDDPAQRQFGAYELREKLGQGGMGVVYRAYQPALDREVAIKLLAAGPWASAEFIARFQREAQHAARLNHPNIVPIHEIGTHEELNFFSMALIRGQTLARRIADQGPLPAQVAAALLLTVAEALDYAHRLGVLHLDLKPGNVLLDERGVPMVADFGLARRLDQSLAVDSDEVSGTPSYMAPEQATLKSHKLSPATDVYGLGAILYEMLTGQPPFVGATPQETLKRVVAEEPESLRKIVPTLPADLEAIASKCLAKDPKDRYASARELAEDLARFRDDRPVSVRPLGAFQRLVRASKREPRIAALAALFVLALIGGLVATAIQWRRAESGEARAETSASHARTALWNERIETAWRDLPRRGALEVVPAMIDNLAEQEAAGATAEAERSRTRIGALLASAPQLIDVIPGSGAIGAVAIAPDGSWVASARGTTVAIHEVDSGAERCRVDAADDGADSWAGAVIADLRPIGDGSRILAVQSTPGGHLARNPRPRWVGLLVDTGDCTPVRPPPDRFGRDAHATYSPDAEYAIVRRAPDSDGELVRVRAWSKLGDVGFPPAHGHEWLLAPGLAHAALVSDSYARVEVLDPHTLMPRHRYVHGAREWLRAWAWNRSGSRLALAFMGGDVVLLDPASGAVTTMRSQQIGSDPFALAFSANDAWLAACFVDSMQHFSVTAWDVASRWPVGAPIRLRPRAGQALPDAIRSTVFVRDAQSAQLWSLAGRGSEPVSLWQRPAAAQRAFGAPAGWNADASLLTIGSADGELQLWRIPDQAPVPGLGAPLALNEADPAFDGRHVANVEGTNAVVIDLDTGAAAGLPVAHPQAVSFALLATEPPRLISSAGPWLHVHDWRDGKAAYAPVGLESTPTTVALAPVTQAVLIQYSARNGERNVTVLESYALATGARTGRVEFDGLAGQFGFSNDGRRVLVRLTGSVRVLDSSSLADVWPAVQFGPDTLPASRAHYAKVGALGPLPAEASGLGILAALDRAAGTLWVGIIRPDAGVSGLAAQYELVAVDGHTGQVERTWRIDTRFGSMSALPRDRIALLMSDFGTVRIVSRDGSLREIALPGVSTYAGTALSGDGRRLAVAQNRSAAVFDLDSGEWLTPALTATLAPDDRVSGLSLDRTGSALLVRTMARNRLRFRLPREDRPLGELRHSMELRHAGVRTPGADPEPAIDDGLRARLRATDPGPPIRPFVKSVAASVPAIDADPRFVDLAPACTRQPGDPLDDVWFEFDRALPPGRHRLLGVDFDWRCGVHASSVEVDPAFSTPAGRRSRAIPVAMPRVDAIEILVTGATPDPDRADLPYAIIEFGYRDGSIARAPIAYRRQVWDFHQTTGHGGDARVAYYATSSRDGVWGSNPPSLFAVRLANPHPERDLDSLALEAVDRPWSSPMLMAVTLDPVREARQ